MKKVITCPTRICTCEDGARCFGGGGHGWEECNEYLKLSPLASSDNKCWLSFCKPVALFELFGAAHQIPKKHYLPRVFEQLKNHTSIHLTQD
jgi:hypothetical protein